MPTAVELMLSAVRTQVCGGERCSFGKLSVDMMQELYAISKSQDLAHIVAVELEQQGLLSETDAEIAAKFRKQQMIAILRYERINYELEAICKVLEEKKIPHIPLKGSVLRRYYPEPWMRTSADIDLLIHSNDLETSVRFLIERLKYRQEASGTDYDLSLFSPSGVHVELHYGMITEDRAANSCAVLEKFWQYSKPEPSWNYRYITEPSMFYFYHIAHLVKHFENSGCGVRFFLDLWVLNHCLELDSKEKEQLLDEGGLLRFSKAATLLSEVWFGNSKHTKITQNMADYVFCGGIYGTQHHRMVTQNIKKRGTIGYAFSRVFPSYRTMKHIYPFLEAHKWLLPFFHVRRWCRIVFCGGLKHSMEEIKYSADIDKNQKEHTKSMLRTLGLLE